MSGKSVRLSIYMEQELIDRIDIASQKLNMNRSEFTRYACEKLLSKEASKEGIDETTVILRKLLQDEFRPQVDRLAKMIYKNTKASATTMYMQLVELTNIENLDAVTVYRESEKKAVIYASKKEE